MTLFQDNQSPYLTATEQGSTPSDPAAGDQRLFVDSADHLLKLVDSSGTVTTVGGGLTNPMTTKGDVILGDTGGTPTRLGAGTSGDVLTSNGAAAFPSWQTPGGGGSFTHAYVGYNTIGGSNETVAGGSISYFKAFTPGSSGLLCSVGAYFEQTSSDNYFSFQVAVNLDDSGSPGAIIASSGVSVASASQLIIEKNNSGVSDPNWLSRPCVSYLTSGTQYWLQVLTSSAAAVVKIYYDTSGSDPTNNNGGSNAVADGRRYTLTDSTKKYSIRGDFIS